MRCPNGSRKKKGVCVCKRGWTMIKGVCVPDVEQPAKRCPVNSKRVKGRCVCNKSFDMIRGFCVPKSNRNRSNRPLVKTVRPLVKTLNNHAKIIQSKFRKSKHSLRSDYLKRHCPGSSECLILGQKRKEILQHFNDFKNFDYSDKILTPIGVSSVNGCVHEIKFKHRDYVSYAVLKTSKNSLSDNLIYEYFMGLFINKVNEYLPSFLETYGLYKCTPEFHTKLISGQPVMIDKDIVPLIATNTEIIKRGCTNPLYNQILIQHIKNAEPLLSKLIDKIFLRDELFYVLFQVYAALYSLRDKFTHFDLHANNILLQKPFRDGSIEFHYDDIVFHSPYIVKIIDYGRVESRITPTLYEEVCNTPECSPSCGKNAGFKTYLKNTDETSDMRLLHNLRDKLPKKILDHIPEELLDIFNTKNITECYQAFTTFLRHDINNSNYPQFLKLLREDIGKINGVLKIDTTLKKPFEWIPN